MIVICFTVPPSQFSSQKANSMQSYVNYIEQEYSIDKNGKSHKPIYSEVYYLQSNSATGIAETNYQTEGARCIFLQYLYQQIDIAVPAPVVYTDQYNNIIFASNTVGFTWAPIFAVKKGAQIRIKSNVPAVLFSISYQYIM